MLFKTNSWRTNLKNRKLMLRTFTFRCPVKESIHNPQYNRMAHRSIQISIQTEGELIFTKSQTCAYSASVSRICLPFYHWSWNLSHYNYIHWSKELYFQFFTSLSRSWFKVYQQIFHPPYISLRLFFFILERLLGIITMHMKILT